MFLLFRKDPFISKINLSFCISGPDGKAIKRGGGWRESNYTFMNTHELGLMISVCILNFFFFFVFVFRGLFDFWRCFLLLFFLFFVMCLLLMFYFCVVLCFAVVVVVGCCCCC